MFLTHALRAIYRSAVAASDALWEYVTLLLTGSPQTSTFVTDASTNNFQVTINGDTRPNNFSPYTTGYYSNLFNGTTDYLSVPLNSAFDITGDFTIECWVYFTALPSPNQDGNRVASMAGYSNGTTANQGFELGVNFTGNEFAMASWGSGNRAMCSFTPVLNTWYHFAATKQSSTSRLFINGVSQTLTANTLTINSAPAGSVLNIGRSSSSSGGVLNYFHYVPGYISNFRIVKGTAVYTASFTPPTAPLTAIANTSLLTCQANRLIDSSTNNFAITRSGDVSISPFDPFVPSNTFRTYGSTYFDGTGDYLTIASNAAFAFGTNNYTYECWVYLSSTSASNQMLIDSRNALPTAGQPVLYLNTLRQPIFFIENSGNIISSSSALPLGSWNHIAVSKVSGTYTLYVNGSSVGTAANAVSIPVSGIKIGVDYSNIASFFIGHIADVRIVNGTAVYTANFTPPTAPLTAIAGTSLLTLQTNQPISNNTFLDNSSLGSFITRNGNATQGSFSPYGGDWSNYFDGTGDYLTVPNNVALQMSGNFTWEAWLYPLSLPSSGNFKTLWAQRAAVVGGSAAGEYGGPCVVIDSSGNYLLYIADGTGSTWSVSGFNPGLGVLVNQWQHIALVKNGSTVTFYRNGVAGTSTTHSTAVASASSLSLMAGTSGGAQAVDGYMSNFRIVKGTAVYTANFTPSTTPLTAVANTSLLTCQSNSLIDNSLNRFAITRNGDVSVQPFSPFHPVSVLPVSYGAYFDGSGDSLQAPSSSSISGTGDFTAECWVYPTTIPGTYNIIGCSDASGGLTMFGLNSNGTIFMGRSLVDAQATTSNSLSYNTWSHIAISRSSGTVRLFINGVQGYSGSITTNYTAGTVRLGTDGGGSALPYTGYISNFRIVKGTAVYTANFTPPTLPLTAVANTSLLTCQSDRFIDNSTNNFAITNNGDARPVTQNPFGSTSTLTTGYDVTTVGGSAYFDGTGDYLALPYTTAAFFLQNSYTIEAWVNPANVSTWKPIFTITAANTGGFGALALVVGNAAAYAEVRPTTGGSISSITGGTIVPNVWHHIALSVNNTSARLFLNGVQVGSTVTFPNFSFTPVGAAVGVNANLFGTSTDIFNGYISDLRVIKGTALYTGPFVPPVAPVTAIQNTTFLGNFTSAGVIDYSGQGNLETVGGARVSTAVSKYSGSSLVFNGTTDYLYVPPNPNNALGTGNFTLECWVYATATPSDVGIFESRTNGLGATENGFTITAFSSSVIRIFCNGILVSSTGTSYVNTWCHVAVVRSSGTWNLYINGVSQGTASASRNLTNTDAVIGAGRYNANSIPSAFFPGYIDDLRITRGVARYTANFTPPTAALPTF